MDPLGSQVSERKMRTRTYGRVAWTVAWTVAEFSLVKEEKVEVEKWEVEKWEVRPSGMLVQMRNAYDDVVGEPAPTIRVKVKYCSAYHEINISAQATFGEMKKELSARMGFHPLNMKLMYKEKERESATFLDVVGVKDRSKILLMEDPMPKAKCILEMHKTDKIDKAAKSVSAICLEVDRLASKDPKRKVHKPVKGVLKLEVEKLHTSLVDVDNISDGGSIIIDSNDDGDRFTETSLGKHHSNGPDIPRSGNLKFIGINQKDICRNVLIPAREDHPDFSDHVTSILSTIYQHSIYNLALTHHEVQ